MSQEEVMDKTEESQVNRRSFIQIMGASAALASMGGCILRRPKEHIVPYNALPEDMVLGDSLDYASSFNLTGDVQGLLVKSYEGRPTKIEGLPTHPDNKGKTNAQSQAMVLELYDPDRSFAPSKNGIVSTWDVFEKEWVKELKGSKIAFLVENTNSPSFNKLTNQFENAAWYQYTPVSDVNVTEGTNLAFGSSYAVHPDYSKADKILALDCDFLSTEPGNVKATIEFADKRHDKKTNKMNRLYAVESRFTLTGGKADHRIAVKSAEVLDVLLGLVSELADKKEDLRSLSAKKLTDKKLQQRVALIADDLLKAGKNSLVVAGVNQPALVHALVAAVNQILGAEGTTVTYTKIHDDVDYGSIKELVDSLNNEDVETLVIIGANPVYNAPADLKFEQAMKKAKTTIHHGLHRDETAAVCQWHLNAAHGLESWGDWYTADGKVSLQQPLIEPLSEVVKGSVKIGDKAEKAYSAIELLTVLSGGAESGHDTVSQHSGLIGAGWKKAVHDGLISGRAYPPQTSAIRLKNIANKIATVPVVSSKSLEVVFSIDAKVHDGRYANNGWLQELPDPMTKIAWDNPVLISHATAKEYGLSEADLVEVSVAGVKAKGAVHIMPGQAKNSLTLTLGYGRTFDGEKGVVARDVGFNFYTLRTSDAMNFTSGAKITPIGTYSFANSQPHSVQEDRDLVKHYDLDLYKQDPKIATRDIENDIPKNMQQKYAHLKEKTTTKSLSTDLDFTKGYQWGMSIDLTRCTGCAGCTVACQSENNIPIVGKEEMKIGREMHWIRMDRYFTYQGGDNLKQQQGTAEFKDKSLPISHEGDNYDESDVSIATMPVACQHCETAPCEEVCPVAATSHSQEGLNDMTYNRCVGTRYCSNNCPYKVRRYNYYHFAQKSPWVSPGTTWGTDATFGYTKLDKLDKMQANPHVTVRYRGVMEKCTYCVQRINKARMDVKGEGKVLNDQDGTTPTPACAQACPADAIVFGDIKDPKSKVSELRNVDSSYKLLEAINTKPRTTFISAIKNPHPEWV